MTNPLHGKYLAIFCKEEVWKLRFKPDQAAVPLLLLVGRDAGRSHFVVSMDAEDCQAKAIKNPFDLLVCLIAIEVGSDIAKDHKDVICGGLVFFEVFLEPLGATMNITSVINHIFTFLWKPL